MSAALPSLKASAVLVAAGYRRFATYRLATVAGAFTNTVFGLIKVSILFAAAGAAGGTVAGYNRVDLSTYTWITQGLIAVVSVWGGAPFAQRIRTGDIAIDLARPAHPVALWLAEDVGRAGQACVVRLVVPTVIGGLAYGLRVPHHLVTVPLLVLSTVLAVLVSFGCRLLVNLTAFWLLDVRGVTTLYALVSQMLCGLLIPVAFLPGWLRTIAYLTPFPAFMQVPVDIAVERHAGLAAVGWLGIQAGWAVSLLVLGVLVLRAGTRRLVVQGG